jgi:hypothetical protein
MQRVAYDIIVTTTATAASSSPRLFPLVEFLILRLLLVEMEGSQDEQGYDEQQHCHDDVGPGICRVAGGAVAVAVTLGSSATTTTTTIATIIITAAAGSVAAAGSGATASGGGGGGTHIHAAFGALVQGAAS